MKVLSATLLLLTLFGIASADGCNNALLTSEVIARFGGSANILTTPRTLGTAEGICNFLANQTVCVSEAGMSYFKTYLEEYKSNFTSRSQSRDQQRYNGVGSNLNEQNQTDQRTQNIIQVGGTFNQTVINFNMSGQQAPYDFTQFLQKIAQKGANQYIAPSQGQAQKQNQLQMHENVQRGRPPCQGVDNSTTGAATTEGSNQCGMSQGGQNMGNQMMQGGSNQQQMQGQSQQQGAGGSNQQMQGQNQQQGGGMQSGSSGSSQMGAGGQQMQGQSQTGTGGSQMGSGGQQSQLPGGNLRLRVLQNTQQSTGNQQQSGQQNQQQGGNQNMGGSGGQGNQQGPPQTNSAWRSVQDNLGQSKAKCAKAVMKQYYFATCLAAASDAATNGTVTGTTSSPTITVSQNACNGYKEKCTDYFTSASQAEGAKSNVDNANSLWAMQIYAIVSNSSISDTEKNTQLNTYAVQVLSELNQLAANPNTRPWVPLSCNSSNTGASDCNYICTNVITPTGFNEDNFNTISTTSTSQTTVTTSRVLGSGGVILSSTGGINPDSAISDSNSAVTVSVQSTPDTSSAKALVASVAVLIASIVLFF